MHWFWALLLTGAFLIWVAIAVWLATALITPPRLESVSPTPARSAGAATSVLSFPPEMVAMAVALTTAVAPTPTATPPPPTPTPTALPVMVVCGMGSAPGDVCKWPHPTPTPEPPMVECLTPIPGEVCVDRGRIVRGATPLPVATPTVLAALPWAPR